MWAAVVTPVTGLAGGGGTVPDAVRDVLRAVYLGAWVFHTAPNSPVVVRDDGGRQIVDLSGVRYRSAAEFTQFLVDHGGDVALLWSADGPGDPVSRLRGALGVPLSPRDVDELGWVPEVSEQWRAELFSAVSAFGLARQWLEDQIGLLPERAAVLPGQQPAGPGQQTVWDSAVEAAGREDLIRRWEALVRDHVTRMDRPEHAERALPPPADRDQDHSQARSALDRLSDRYVNELRVLSRTRAPRSVGVYVRSVPAANVGDLMVRLDQAETAAAELDQHLGQVVPDGRVAAGDAAVAAQP
ncbi:hypothetical protein OOK41_22035 [Micromonospora sp. NBC_01655]|uniref:hypothetical protein n=1 Tax=Micromonospora sp. NBC_01655 TaxID=2975983 RepID=UPI0022515E2F|nr:hypothetical protein [Micromonospora sp. NBC_01655]MCX4472959.1 hypothetical protein [Micromonospora sp. NBC_01655]